MTGPAVIGIAGFKNAGKTTLAEKLISELTRRGYRVSTVKRAHHSVDIDEEGRDSHRHRSAGAQEVALVTAHRLALLREYRDDPEPTLDDVIARMEPCDIVLVEGFKSADFPKIEVRRADTGQGSPESAIPDTIAIAADHAIDGADVPILPLDDARAIADFIVDRFALEVRDAPARR